MVSETGTVSETVRGRATGGGRSDRPAERGDARGRPQTHGGGGAAPRGQRSDGRRREERVRHALLVGLGEERDRRGRPTALVPVLGRSPFQRHLHHLSERGVGHLRVVLESEDRTASELRETCERQAAEISTKGMEIRFACGAWLEEAASEREAPRLPGPLVVVRAEGVYDPRLYREVLEGPDGTWVADEASRAGSRADGRGRGDAARLPGHGEDPHARGRGERRDGWVPVGLARHGRLPETPRGEDGRRARDEDGTRSLFVGTEEGRVRVSELDDYLPDRRRRLRPYWVWVRDRSDRAAAAERILDSAQKGVLDFPARYLHPPVEDFLTRCLAGTPVTPNLVTVATGVLGFLAAWLFASGGSTAHAGALGLALLVNVLDGVDGKLARVELLTSRFGDRLDHTLDVSFEFAWYLAIGWGLSGGEAGEPFGVALALVATMLGTRAVSGAYRWLSGRQIHDHRVFDRAFRLIAGRRNIYVLVWVAGLAAGALEGSFRLCLAWAGVTLAVYLARTAMAGWHRARAAGRAGPERASG